MAGKPIILFFFLATLSLATVFGKLNKVTQLRITNNSGLDITNTTVTDTDDYDWASDYRPDVNFQGETIQNGAQVEHREEVYYWASKCPFTMLITYEDASEDIFRINMKFAIGDSSADFTQKKETHRIFYERVEENVLEIFIEGAVAFEDVESNDIELNGVEPIVELQ